MKKTLSMLLAALLCLSLVFGVAACDGESAISFAEDAVKVHVGESEQLSVVGEYEGTVTYESSDTAVAEVSADGNVTAKSVGTATITASVGGDEAECEVSVWNTSLTAPAQREYYVGATEPDLTGGQIVITQADGSTDTVSLRAASVTLKSFDASSAGEKQVVLTYDGRDYSYSVTVKDLVFGKDTMKDEAYFASYPLQESYCTARVTENGVVMTKAATSNYGSVTFTAVAPADAYAVVIKVSSQTAGQTFDFSFKDATITENTDHEPHFVSKYYRGTGELPPLHVARGTDGSAGDVSTAKAGTYTGVYSFLTDDGSEGKLGWNANNEPFLEKLQSGAPMQVRVGYEGAEGDFTIEEFYFIDREEYETATSMTLTPPTKTEYVVGEDLDLTGGSLTLSNVFGETYKTIALDAEGVEVTGFNSSAATDSQTVTVAYGGLSETFTVSVAEPSEGVTLVAPTAKNYQGATTPYLAGGYFEVSGGAGEPTQVPLTDSRVTVKSFDSETLGVPAENNVVLTFEGQDYGYKSEIISPVATQDNNIINAVYLTNFGFSTENGNNAAARITVDGKLAYSYTDGWGSVDISVCAPEDTYAVYVKMSSETNGLTVNFMFRDETITTNQDQMPQHSGDWYKGEDPVPPLHARNGDKAAAVAGTYAAAFRFLMDENVEGDLGWNANNQPFLDKLKTGAPMTLRLGANGADGEVVIEEVYFLNQSQYEALQAA